VFLTQNIFFYFVKKVCTYNASDLRADAAVEGLTRGASFTNLDIGRKFFRQNIVPKIINKDPWKNNKYSFEYWQDSFLGIWLSAMLLA
jgi:hypothetical protein